jgi:hypothetical protein
MKNVSTTPNLYFKVFKGGTPFKDANAFTIHFSQITNVNKFSF